MAPEGQMIENATAANNNGATKGLQGYNFITVFCMGCVATLVIMWIIPRMMSLTLSLALTAYVNPF